MKKIFFLFSIVFCVFTKAQEKETLIFQYKNSQSTTNIFADYFIVLEKENNQFTGYFYGNTDVFEDVREGYIPAYFAKKIDNLVIDFFIQKISFEVNVSNDDFLYGKYYNPIPLSARSTAEAKQKGYKKWERGNLGKHLQRKFSGYLDFYNGRIESFGIFKEPNKEKLYFELKELPKDIKNLDFIIEQSFMETN